MRNLQWVKDPNHIEILPGPDITEWLTKPYILSHALKRISKALTVKVLDQRFGHAYEDEYAILNITPDPLPFVRQVFLQGDDESPLTYGRVIIPNATYHVHFPQFETLGTNLLGETLLYNNPDVSRGPFEYVHVPPRHSLATQVYDHLPIDYPRQPLWGRRSVFWIKTAPLLVMELFLPLLPPYPA